MPTLQKRLEKLCPWEVSVITDAMEHLKGVLDRRPEPLTDEDIDLYLEFAFSQIALSDEISRSKSMLHFGSISGGESNWEREAREKCKELKARCAERGLEPKSHWHSVVI